MINALFATLGCLFIVGIAESLYRKKKIKGEVARKIVHFLFGFWIASWPWFVGRNWILFLSLGALSIAILLKNWRWLSNKLRIAKYIRGLRRSSYGEFFFGAGVFFCAAFTKDKELFALALLIMTLADGLAALIGQKYGKKNRYEIVPGAKKSLVGSLAFFLISLFIIVLFMSNILPENILQANVTMFQKLVASFWLSIVLTVVEAGSPKGVDNVLLPIVVIFALGVQS